MRLILINGVTGAGKSTIARRLHQELPLSFLLEIDELRRSIQQYAERPKESRALSFAVALAITETCLQHARDVIVDRMLYRFREGDQRMKYFDHFLELGKKYGADISHVILHVDQDTMRARLEKRGFHPSGLLTLEKAERFCNEMEQFKDERPEAMLVETTARSVDEVYQQVRNHVLH